MHLPDWKQKYPSTFLWNNKNSLLSNTKKHQHLCDLAAGLFGVLQVPLNQKFKFISLLARICMYQTRN